MTAAITLPAPECTCLAFELSADDRMAASIRARAEVSRGFADLPLWADVRAVGL